MKTDEYKYRVAVVADKVRINLHPLTIKDIMRYVNYTEMQSYLPDLKRFRPILKIQSFIDLRKSLKGKPLPEKVEEKRKAVVRDWFKLVLWYIRLRHAAKGKTPESLLRVEERLQRQKLFNGLTRAR
jgi:hypothetical protein